MITNKEQSELIEKIGLNLETKLKLSPLASRIYTLLILSAYDGLTFEEIRQTIQASKSATSVNINVLTQLDYVVSYTKPGERKRYFKLAKHSQVIALEGELQKIRAEMEMVNEINSYNKKYHSEKFVNEVTLGNILQNHLVAKQQLLKTTIAEMKAFEIDDSQF